MSLAMVGRIEVEEDWRARRKKENGDSKLKLGENKYMKGVVAGGRSKIKGKLLFIYYLRGETWHV